MDDEKEDIEFRELLSDRRHKEIKATLKDIAAALNKPSNDGYESLIRQNAELSRALIGAIRALPAPEVNVQVDNKSMLTLLEDVCDKVVQSNKEVMDAVSNKLYVDSFVVVNSGFSGNEKTINVVYKPMAQLNIKK